MSQIVQQGALNTTALVVPDVYVQIIPPQVAYLNGVPTNILGLVGVAQWGPANSPITIANAGDIASKLGAIGNRANDLATACAIAIQQGANNIRAVRVTDGTDVAATGALKDTTTPTAVTGATLTAIYTGTLGNQLQATVSQGSAQNSYKLVLAIPGLVPEVFDNIVGTGAAFWTNLVAAVNNGNSAVRGPSRLVTAATGAATATPAQATITLTGGTDGTSTINTAKLIGVDGALGTRTGMYALRGTGASVATIADLSDSTSWASQLAFGLSEGIYMVTSGPAGQTPTTAVTAKQTAGIDNFGIKIMLGDWITWNDTVNNAQRLLSPATFDAGLLSNLAPQNSGLNKQVYGIVATQTSQNNQTYSSADLQTLEQGGIDVITNPVPGGSYFGPRIGHNAASNAAVQGDNYTRMTNYLASTLAAGMGQFVGLLQSTSPTDPLRARVKATVDSFLQNMVEQGQLDSFSTVCDLSNNPPSRIALGYLQIDVIAKYLGVVEKLLVNLQGGQSVSVAHVSTAPAQ